MALRQGAGRPAKAVPAGNGFGAWLRAEREKRGLTGEALAFRVGGSTTQGMISSYERGVKNPSRRTVDALADALAGLDATDEQREAKRQEARLAASGGTPLIRIPDELWPIIHSYNGIPDARERERIRRIMETSVEVYGTEPPEELADYSSIPPKDRPSARPKAGEP